MKYCGGALGKAQKSSKQDQQKVEIHVANVFIKIFAFLIPYTKWCISRFTRIRSSLNKNFYEESVQRPLNNILKETKNLEREGNLKVQEGVLQVVRGQDSAERKIDLLTSQVEKLQMSLDENLSKRSERLAIANDHDDGKKKKRLLIELGTMGTKFVEVMTQTELERDLLEKERRERVQGTLTKSGPPATLKLTSSRRCPAKTTAFQPMDNAPPVNEYLQTGRHSRKRKFAPIRQCRSRISPSRSSS